MSQFLRNRRHLILLLILFLLPLLFTAVQYIQHAKGVQAAASGTVANHLPLVISDPTPTPFSIPKLPFSAYDLIVQITPNGGIDASTFDADSFILRNKSTNGHRILEVRFDLSTAVLPDMVFDPYGLGGDTLAKDLEANYDEDAGYAKSYFLGPHSGGYDILVIEFSHFIPGGEFRFAIDVDPNSIKGVDAPGPNDSGSVSGIELMGSTVSVLFADGTSLSQQTAGIPGSEGGSEARLRTGLPAAPQISIISAPPPPATVNNARQITRISGAEWQPGRLLVLEGGLFLDGVPDGGHNVKPYDANSVVAVHEYEVQTGPAGSVDIGVNLSRSMSEAGLNHFVAAFGNYYGMRGQPSESLLLEYLP